MKFPNKYLRNLKPYKLASHKIWSVPAKERTDILKLDWNEATIPPSPKVRERILRILEDPCFFNLYPTTYNDELVTLLSDYVGLPKENIQYFGSSDALHEYICKVFISVGDPVMILGPSYDNFRLTCQANGAEVFFSYYKNDFTFDAAAFEEAINKIEPAVVYICNPNNPTGNVHQKLYIEHLLNEFPDTLFLIDEAYYEFSGITCKDLVVKYDNILISRTMSKAFALANFRVGYLIASKDNVQFVNRIRNPKNLSTFAQEAACGALSDLQYMWNYVDEVHKAMKEFAEAMQKHESVFKTIPSNGNFLMLHFDRHEDKMALLNYLAEHNIFARDTTQADCVRNCFRITMGTRTQMHHVSQVIDSFYGSK
jgi:histidinol-phosphate aminotransferase